MPRLRCPQPYCKNFYDGPLRAGETVTCSACSLTMLDGLPGGKPDPVNHPPHYTSHPSGVECIDITEHMSFPIGNVVKYLWRADEKGAPLQDLEKARWYLDREISRRKKETTEG